MSATTKKQGARATLDLLVEMKAQGLPVTSLHHCYNEALYACVKASMDDNNGSHGEGYLSDARVLFEKLLQTEPGPNLHNYNTYVKVLAEHGQVEEAWRVLRQMVERGVRPDVITYNAYLHVLGVHGRVEEAWRVLRLMTARSVQPSKISYGTVLDACGPERKWPVALFLYGEAECVLRAGQDGAPSGREMPRGMSENESRSLLLRALLGMLEQSGVDGLFVARAYGETVSRGRVSHWVPDREGDGKALDFHDFTRVTAKAAMTHVLERDFVRPFAASAGTLRPLGILVGRGRHSTDGRPQLEEGVQRLLTSLDPPLLAVTPPHNPGRLVVSADQLQAYVEAQLRRRRQATGAGLKGDLSGMLELFV